MPSQVRYLTDGVLLPLEWFQDLGTDLNIEKSGRVIIIESAQRQAARRRLRALTQRLRQAGDELGTLSEIELTTIVQEVRAQRARHH